MLGNKRTYPVYKIQSIDLRGLSLDEAKVKLIDQYRALGAKIPRNDAERYATHPTHRQIRMPLDSVILRMTEVSHPVAIGVLRTTQRVQDHRHADPKLRVRIKVGLAASEFEVRRHLELFQDFLIECARDVA